MFTVFGFKFYAVVTVLSYAFTYLISDVVQEYYGPVLAKRFVYPGFCALVLASAFFWIFVEIPPTEHFKHQKAYATILRPSLGFVVAGIFAYLVSQQVNISVFGYLKRRYSWILIWGSRNPVSTLISQAFDTVIFVLLGFCVLPGLIPFGDFAPVELSKVPFLMSGQYVLKLVITLASWPIFSLIIRVISRGDFRPPP